MLNKTYLKLLTACIITSFLPQETDAQSISSYASNGGYTFRSLDKFLKTNFVNTYKTELGLTSYDTLKEKDFDVDSLGNFNARYIQTYKGYEVEGASLTLHGSEGVVLSAGGNLQQNLNVNVSSPISESTALANALSHLGTQNYYWLDSAKEASLKDITEDSTNSYYPHGELIISIPNESSYTAANFNLYWKFSIDYIDTPDKKIYAYVNAITGTVEGIVNRFDNGYFSVGNVQTTYNGWMPFRTYKPNFENWRLEGDNIKTFNHENWIRDDDNSWNNSDEQRVCATVHWAAQKAKEYYIARHKRVGQDGHDGVLLIYANSSHVKQEDIASSGTTNDFWGRKRDMLATSTRVGLSHAGALDIIGHEYTHRVIKTSSGLNPLDQQIEAGILNEGFADIFGLEIENHMVGSAHGWKVGEQVTSPFPFPSYRDFTNPHNSSPHTQPAKYQESGKWISTGTQGYRHRNAGVLTHWFYLLANGGTYNGYTVSGIGMKGASDLAYIVMTGRLWGTSDFSDTRNETVKLAIEWWGECSFLYQQVVKAWMAVGVGNMVYCKKYQLYGKDVLPTKNVGGVIKPAMGKGQFKISAANEATAIPQSISWVIPESWNVTYDGDNMGFTLNSVSSTASQWITAYVTENNVTDTLKHFVHFVECDSPYCIETGEGKFTSSIESTNSTIKKVSVYPNPVNNGSLNIELPIMKTGKHNLYLKNLLGTTVKSLTFNGNFTTIDVSTLASGIYMITIADKEFSETNKIIINQK